MAKDALYIFLVNFSPIRTYRRELFLVIFGSPDRQRVTHMSLQKGRHAHFTDELHFKIFCKCLEDDH